MHKHSTYRKIFLLTFLIFNVYGTRGFFAQDDLLWTAPLKKCWEYKSENLTTFNIASDNDKTIFITELNNYLTAINVDIGSRKWQSKLGSSFSSYPLYKNKQLLLALKLENTQSQSFYKVIEAENGTTTNNHKSRIDYINYIASENGFTYLFTKQGKIEAIKKNILVWKIDLKTKITTSPSLFTDEIILGTSNKTILTINKLNGDINEQLNLKNTPSGLISQDKYTFFVGDIAGYIYSIDKTTKKRNWVVTTGGKIVSTDLFNKRLLIESNDNYVYALSIKKGKKLWKRKLAGRVIGKAHLTEHVAIYLSYGTNTAVLVDLKNGTILNRILLNKDLSFVSRPIYINKTIILPTQKGIFAYARKCK